MATCLGGDAFAVAVSVGHTGSGPRSAFRLSFHFGLFQFLMPILGWLLGARLAWRVKGMENWVAFAILAAVGLHMLSGAWRSPVRHRSRDYSRGLTLIGLSVAVSIDALGAGVGMGILKLPLIRSAALIGLVAALMTLVGVGLSRKFADVLGRLAEGIGGLVLIGLAVYTFGL
ncbi:MAG: manganese efflux pump MntP family protein [Phycisphaerae bacterium]